MTSGSPELNLPEVVAEVSALCDRYETALVDNDVSALQAFFWRSDLAIRFGVTEELYGCDEIDAFRKNRKVSYADRTVQRHDIVTLGRSLAVATLRFTVTVAGKLRHGRQSQVWAKLGDDGWRIISAHVSHRVMPAAFSEADYASAAAVLLDLPVAPMFRESVAENIAAMGRIAEPLMRFELPPDIEPAPVFEP
jgi:hypothetical protein